MSILRREVLRYIEDNGGYVAVESGYASTVVVDDVLEIVAEFGLTSRDSIIVAISQLVTGRALERGGEDGSREAARHKTHRYLGITDVGRRELKWRLGDPLDDEVSRDVQDDAKDADSIAEIEDPIERLHARERGLRDDDQLEAAGIVSEPEPRHVMRRRVPSDPSAEADMDPDEATDEEVAAVAEARAEEDIHAADLLVEHGETREPKPPAMDYQALAAELLRQVLAATRSDDQWVAEVERLEGELKAAQQAVEQVREDSANMVIRLNSKLEDQERARSKLVQELNTAKREREEAVAQHARANEQVGQLRAQLRRALKERDQRPNGQTEQERARELRTYGLDEKEIAKLREIEQAMRESRRPQVDGG